MSQRWTLKEPCSGCPFGRGPEAVRHLRAERLEDIATCDDFVCHKTTQETGNGTEVACAGHLIFKIANEGGLPQLARIMGRLGRIDEATADGWADYADTGAVSIIDLDELIEAHEEGTRG